MLPEVEDHPDERSELLAEVRQAILDHYLEVDSKGRFLNPPGESVKNLPKKSPARISEENRELEEFILHAYGVKFPKKVVIRGHRAPFDFLADLFFERIKNALGFAGRNGGKALSVTTPILTTSGWKTMLDLQKGDKVYSQDGTQTEIDYVSPVMFGNKCFKVTFDSETIIADAEHLWEVHSYWNPEVVVKTTEQLFYDLKAFKKGRYSTLYFIPCCKPLQNDERELQLHPYVYGAWLGDGCSYGATIFSWDDEIVDKLQRFWPTLRKDSSDKHAHLLPKLGVVLHQMGLLKKKASDGHTKRVLAPYLLGSIEQRLDLLHGLMDTDGTSDPKKSRCEFCSVIENLSESVAFLVRSFGAICGIQRKESWTGGPHGVRGLDQYRAMFRPIESFSPFSLSRKVANLVNAKYRVEHKILSVEECPSVPVKCISVRHPSKLYLAGKALIPTHNTFLVAVLNHLDALFKLRCEVASAGAVLDQADKCYRYYQSFNEMPWFIAFCKNYEEKTGKRFLEKSIRSWTEYANGSTVAVITGSEKGLRSPHPIKARIDEIDLMEWSVLQTGLSMAKSSHGHRGQNVFTSTRQLQNGPMQKLLDSSKEKGIEVYEWNIWEYVEQCPRRCVDDPEHGSCPIYTFCKGKAHHSAGFYAIDDFVDKVRLLDRETFETEWENKRPSRHKMVYWMFDNTKHVLTPTSLYDLVQHREPSRLWPRISAIDFGSSPGHPFVYLKLCQLPNGAWMVFHEYIAEQRLIKDHAVSIKNSPFYAPGEYIYSDWASQERLELSHWGIRCKEAKKDVLAGIDYVASLLKGFPPKEDPMLYFWEGCPITIEEFGNYRWPTTPDGRPNKTENPLKVNDHTCDAVRYGLFSHRTDIRPKYRSYKSA